MPNRKPSYEELEAQVAAMREVLEFQVREFPCPGIHATMNNKQKPCPEESDDPNEWCISAKAKKVLAMLDKVTSNGEA